MVDSYLAQPFLKVEMVDLKKLKYKIELKLTSK